MKTIPRNLTSFLWMHAKNHKLSLFALFFVSVYWACHMSLTPYLIKIIIDKVTEIGNSGQASYQEIFLPSACYVLAVLSIGIVYRFCDYVTLSTFPKMRANIIDQMFEYLLGHSHTYFQQNFAGSLSTKIAELAKGTTTLIRYIVDDFVARILGIAIATFTMFIIHPLFATTLLIWMTVVFSTSFFLSLKSEGISKDYSKKRYLMMGKITDAVTNISAIKLFNRQGYEKQYLYNELDIVKTAEKRLHYRLLSIKAFQNVATTCLIGLITWLLINLFRKGLISSGDFALIFWLATDVSNEILNLAEHIVTFAEDFGISAQALLVLSEEKEIVDDPKANKLAIKRGEITFENIFFKYKGSSSVFKGQSITIHAAEKVGLVGYSGSGKSTFVNLIMRFYDLHSGRILIDNQDISKVTQESLHSNIALIPQEPLLFNRSILENISYGKINATEAEIIEASKKAHCHEFIEKLPEGYATLAGERGMKLSGGQRQRIAIARAILKNAPILILDEATSALDSVTEYYIQESLKNLMQNRTTLVIAHRLSTLSDMDRIIVFKAGEIIEDGTPSELMALEGYYAKLWNMQLSGYNNIIDPAVSLLSHESISGIK